MGTIRYATVIVGGPDRRPAFAVGRIAGAAHAQTGMAAGVVDRVHIGPGMAGPGRP